MRSAAILYYIITFIFFVALPNSSGAKVVVSLRMDTNQIYIGEQVLLKLKVAADANQKIILPEFSDSQLVKGVEVINHYTESNNLIDGGRRRVLTEAYRITSFDSALYYIPPFEVMVDTSKYKSNNMLALKVVSPVVDTTKIDKFFGPMENADILYDWSDMKRPVSLWAVGVLLIIVGIYLIMQIRSNRRILPKINLLPEIPPYKVALKQLNRLKKNMPTDEAQTKDFCVKLIDVIRIYIAKQFCFKATAMTTAQIMDNLKKHSKSTDIQSLKEIFETIDLIKYAGAETGTEIINKGLNVATDYVNSTKAVDETTKVRHKKTVKPEAVRGRILNIFLIVLTILIMLLAIVLLTISAYIMYNMVF